jgi:riboflavin kinase/FMN adenylyltransferase
MLGQPIAAIGTVVHGMRIGSKLGFPTANIEPDNEMLPPRGIYAAHLRVGHHLYGAAAYIGHRATFHKNDPPVLEVHLIDQEHIDLYDQKVEVSFLEYIRDDRIFEDPERLKDQIRSDIAVIRSMLQ